MPTFTPPVRLIGATTTVAYSPGNQLFRHYSPRRVGINVYVYADGTIGEADPPLGDLTIQRVYHGGHIHTITQAEATALNAAGYTTSTYELPVAGPGAPNDPSSGALVAAPYGNIYAGSY